MRADEQKVPPPARPPGREPEPRRGFARRIDCHPTTQPRGGRAAREVENGRGTGRLRNPREDH